MVNFLEVPQDIEFKVEKNNAYLFPLEEMINFISCPDTDYKEYPDHITMNSIILNNLTGVEIKL